MPVPLSVEDKALIERVAKDAVRNLEKCYQPGFGVFPTGDPNDVFYNMLWSRDFSHAGGYFAVGNINALLDSLNTIFSFQKKDGSLPYRVEKKRFILEYFLRVLFGIDPGALRKIGIDFVTRRKKRPIYEGERGNNAEDTIPSVISSIGEFFMASKEGREFAENNYEKIRLAIENFIKRTDPEDGLESSGVNNPDWADSIKRGGKKLSTVNIRWEIALERAEKISAELGMGEAKKYDALAKKARKGIMDKLYNEKDHYFRTGEGEERMDAVASILGCLHILPVEESVRVQESMKKRLFCKSGLRNFYPPYPKKRLSFILRIIGMGGYHNEAVWPWVAAVNIHAKIKIAQEHPDKEVREQYRNESVLDLLSLAALFESAGGAYEVFDPDRPEQYRKLRTGIMKYQVPKNFMGNLASYQSVYHRLKKLGWISSDISK